MRLPDPSPVLDKNRAPMGPEILSSTGAGVWRKAPIAFPDSSSVLDKCQSANHGTNGSQIATQMGGVSLTATQDEGTFLQKYRHGSGRCVAILVRSIGGSAVDVTLLSFSRGHL